MQILEFNMPKDIHSTQLTDLWKSAPNIQSLAKEEEFMTYSKKQEWFIFSSTSRHDSISLPLALDALSHDLNAVLQLGLLKTPKALK